MAQKFIKIKDGRGDQQDLSVLLGGENQILNDIIPFKLAVSMGMVDGFSVVDKFGFNKLITSGTDPEDVWEGGGTYPYDDFGTAPIISIASNSVSDTMDVSVQGLDIDGELVVQEITLQGTTRVALSTPLWRVFRLENEGDVDMGGQVFVYTGTGSVPSIGDPEVRALINDGNNQTQMALYTIPKGKTGFLFKGEFGMEFTGSIGTGNQFANLQYRSRRLGKIFKNKKTINLINQGTSIYQETRTFPDIIPELTDIKLTINEVSTDMGITGAFDILLIDTDKLPEYLQILLA